LYNFYRQILTGDSADNIIGLRGIGNITADKMMKEAVSELDMYKICVDAYEGNVERVLENGILLWLRRYEGQTWTPPLEETV
jgi:hypothetical protein